MTETLQAGPQHAPPPLPPAQRLGERLDAPRLAFWAALAMGAGAVGVALTAGASVGRIGAVLLISFAALALVFLVWLSRGSGRQIGLFPERGAAEAAAMIMIRNEYALLEALEEAALVTDRSGAPVAANAAYVALAEAAGEAVEAGRAPVIDRLFGADPAMSAPMYRLAKAAAAGQRRAEDLPAVALGGEGAMRRLHASVAPLSQGRTLWRLRAAGAGAAAGADAMPGAALFLDDSPVGFFVARADGAIVYLNRALKSVLGVGEEGDRLRVRDIVKEDPARILRREKRGFGAARTAVTLRGRDGTETAAVAVTYWPAIDADGAARTFVFFDGLETPAAAVPAADRAAEPIEAFFTHAPFGAALLDGADPATAAILDANAALMEMAQGRASPGSPFAHLFEAAEGPDALAQRLRQAVSGQAVEVSLATEPPTAAHIRFARLGDGRALAYVVNVTEQRELEQRLAQSEKMREIGLLAGGVAHDFNNLLTVMMQTTDYLLLRHPVGDPDYPELNQINIHALRAKELSEMLRAYARQQTFKVEIMEVSGFVQQMHELGRRLAGDGVRVEVNHGAGLPFIKADRTQLERVLVNLISNARDAMTPKDGAIPGGGVLGLRTAKVGAGDVRLLSHVPIEDGDYVMIEVSDTGCGIKPEDQPKIFHPFHSTKEPNKGTGLGLATCYGIIKQSGGYIFFDSKQGQGTAFRIFLPAYAPTAAEYEDMARRERERIHRPVVDVAGRGRILFVEDDEGVRRITTRNLRECGFEIVEAEDGEEALALLRAEPGGFDLIISDVSMPLMNGPDMLKAAGPELIGKTKVLFLTGFAPESVARSIQDFKAKVLSKPVGAATLAQQVKELLAA